MFYKGQPIIGFPFELVNKDDGEPITTGAVTGKSVLDDGAQANIAGGSAVHKGGGQWTWSRVSTTVTNGSLLGLMFTHASAIGAHFTLSIASITDASIHALASASKVDAALILAAQPAIGVNASVAAVQATLGVAGAVATQAQVSAVNVKASSILTDTGTTIPSTLTAIGVDASVAAVQAALAVTNQTTILAKVSAVKIDTSATLTDTGTTLPATLSAQDVKAAAASVLASVQGVLISEIFMVHGLNSAHPMVNKPARRYNAASTLVQTFVGTADTSITVTRV